MPKKQPKRMCVSCRARKDKSELVRLVAGDADNVVVDPTGKRPGRGAYVCKTRACLSDALTKHKLDRGLKITVSPGCEEELWVAIETMISHRPSGQRHIRARDGHKTDREDGGT